MLGDLDLIHHVARDSRATPVADAAAGAHRLSRMSLDSNLSSASNASGSLSGSWGGFATSASPKSASFLLRQFSGREPADAPLSASAPVNIPSRAAAGGGASAGAPPSLRRGSLLTGAILEERGAPAAPPASSADALRGHRMPVLVRSLSKGLSASLDFR